MYNWYGDRVERREWCKLASPLGRRTQPLLSPASESSGPLRFQATRASTPDLDADCESCVAPDSPNLSSDEFDDECEGTRTSTEDRSHTKLRREDFARSILP